MKFSTQFLPDRESERAAAEARERVMGEIRRLELTAHVGELEAQGFTVLAPEKVSAGDFAQRLCKQVLAVSGKRASITVDIADGRTHSALQSPFGSVQFEASLLLEDPIFEQALMNESVLALITYLLGESCILSHLSSMVKGPAPEYLPLHADQNQSGPPSPFSPYAQVANATWALTDYTREDGAICFVPCSHKLCRAPTPQEATDPTLFQPLEVRAGSVIVWHGNTWHGAVPRSKPGVRVNLVEYFQRWYIAPFESLRERITTEMLQRNPPRFAWLTGVSQPLLDNPNSAHAKAARTSLFA